MIVHEEDVSKSQQAGRDSGRVWPDWYAELANYRGPDSRKASWQLVTALVPYFALWYLMIRSVKGGAPYMVTLGLAMVAAAFLVRIFILFHDCVHGAFLTSRGMNTFLGYFLGVLVFTSFDDWRFSHLRHHVTYANLDARGFGDIWTMTRTEYESSTKTTRVLYRLYRNPLVLIGLGALFIFVLRNRLPTRKVRRKERSGVLFTNLLIAAVVLVACHAFGWRTYLVIQLPVLWFAGAAGIWLFYVQHQFPGGYWAHKQAWKALRAAMEGSSFYDLPAVLRWFSGSIGYHHIHHLDPRIPNYRLRQCYQDVPALQIKKPLAFKQSLSCMHLKLWDEKRQKLVPFPR